MVGGAAPLRTRCTFEDREVLMDVNQGMRFEVCWVLRVRRDIALHQDFEDVMKREFAYLGEVVFRYIVRSSARQRATDADAQLTQDQEGLEVRLGDHNFAKVCRRLPTSVFEQHAADPSAVREAGSTMYYRHGGLRRCAAALYRTAA